jgi:hypothetical protein
MEMQSAPVKIREKDENGKSMEKEVGTATYPVYVSWQEVMDHIGEDQAIKLINAQSRTNELNRVRELARNGPGKKAMEREAMDWIGSNWKPEDWQKIAGVPGALQAAIERKAAELTAEKKASLVASGASEDES